MVCSVPYKIHYLFTYTVNFLTELEVHKSELEVHKPSHFHNCFKLLKDVITFKI